MVLAIVLAIRLLGGDDVPAPTEAPIPPLTDVFIDERIGVTVRFPEDWSARRQDDAVRVRHEDRSALVSVAAPAPADEARQLLTAAVGGVAGDFEEVERLGTQDIALGGYAGRARLLTGTNEEGAAVRVLLAALEGERRAYLVTTFSAADADLRLLQVEQILTSLQFGR